MNAKILVPLKSCAESFSTNIDHHNIEKTLKKSVILFSADVDRCKTFRLVYVKFWKQACLPASFLALNYSLITPYLVLKLKRCQRWLLRKVSHAPKLALGILLLQS